MTGSGAMLVVGVEVHVQLATDTKTFCGCPVEFGAPPNTRVCPVCLGHPGALPVLNRRAVEQALRAGVALGCAVAPRGRALWDRKNYFYPDLPKGYQITQYEFPLCEAGEVRLSTGRVVLVRRAHLEEDTGKSSHARDGATLLDFNRCGAPLLEIVTEPMEGTTPEEVEEYVRLLQERVRLVGAAEAAMEKGQMRCEPNVSLRRADGTSTGITELKNLSSFASVRAAVAHERERLATGPWHPEGAVLPRATYGWDETSGRTILQRTKETAADYRYFPEPDLPVLPAAALAAMAAAAREAVAAAENARDAAASDARAAAERYGLAPEQAALLLERDITGGRFLEAARAAEEAGGAGAGGTLAAWFLGPLAGWVNGRGGDWGALRASAAELAAAAALVIDGKVTAQIVKTHLLAGEWPGVGGDPAAHLAGRGLLGGAAGTDAVRTACVEVLAANPDVVAKIRGGKPQAKQALVGQVMKRTRGAADPKTVNALLDELLGLDGDIPGMSASS